VMRLVDRIIEAEGRFFDKHLTRPNLIVVRPEVKSLLMEDRHRSFLDEDMASYEGMLLLVDFSNDASEFRLGFVE